MSNVQNLLANSGRVIVARFLAIRQEGSVANFIKKFVSYSTPLTNMAEDVLESTFLNGLKPPIRAAVIR